MCKNRYGITYNKTLLREHGWELPNSFTELEMLAAKAKKAGMDEHLPKPVDISALEQTVKRFRVTPHYRKSRNERNIQTAYLRDAIQRCCCCIKKLNCYK